MGNPLVEKNESWENKVDINIIPAFYKLTIAVCFSTIIVFSSSQVMGRSDTARRYWPNREAIYKTYMLQPKYHVLIGSTSTSTIEKLNEKVGELTWS